MIFPYHAHLAPYRAPAVYLLRRVLILLLLTACPAVAQRDPVTLVHPLIGTANAGQTYPATGVPFAMTHWTPQTRAGEIKCMAPYYFADKRIQGFRGTHFISGSCVPDYGSMTVAAGVGPLHTNAAARSSAFNRATEHASPHAYSVDLDDAGMHARVTGTTRCGMMQYTALRRGLGWMVFENNARAGEGYVHVDSAHSEITGEVPVRREYAGSGKPAGFSSYFVAVFSRSSSGFGTWIGERTHEGQAEQRGDGLPQVVNKVDSALSNAPAGPLSAPALRPEGVRPGFGVYVRFSDLRKGETITVKVGTSFVSVEEARKNLQAEIPDWNVDKVEAAARQEWQRSLGQIELLSASAADPVFYTALYHSLLHPRTASDVDGSYPRFASAGKVEHAKGFIYYDDFSMWDIYRAQLPLVGLLQPGRVGDMMHSLVNKGEEGGFLPIFPAWNNYTSEMTGDHSTVAIVDAWRKGIRSFDIDRAYALMRHNAMESPSSPAEYADGKGRRALQSYLRYGFIPLEDHVPYAFHNNEQVSRTLDYAYDDAVLGLLARDLGKAEDAALFAKRGENWRNVIDPANGFARGRHADGTWAAPFRPDGHYSWITEGLPWQSTFFVPQNVSGLVALEGGPEAFRRKLDSFFAGGYYDPGNEPSQHIAYLYDVVEAPERAAARIRTLMEAEYKDSPGGLPGNDDAGQMSAWYVMSAMGFYPVAPGVPEYWLGVPSFEHLRVKLPNGRTLDISAPGASRGLYAVRRVLLNGKPVQGYKLQHAELAAGGTLVFELANVPLNNSRASSKAQVER